MIFLKMFLRKLKRFFQNLNSMGFTKTMKRGIKLTFPFFAVRIMLISSVFAQEPPKPGGLTINFLSEPGQVFLNGYPVNTPLDEAVNRRENFQFTEISQKQPFFGWIVNSSKANVMQAAYQILVASSPENLLNGVGDMWDSGKSESGQSQNINYRGKLLEPGKVYCWSVKTWDNTGEASSFSEMQQFKTGQVLFDYETARYPLQKQDVAPVTIHPSGNGTSFIDFGKDGFGRIRITLRGEKEGDTVMVHLGETVKNGRIDRHPGGTIRFSSYSLVLKGGWNTYVVTITPDKRNTGPQAIQMPVYTGDVTPFRYCEIENYHEPVLLHQVVRETVFYPFDDSDSYFHCSNSNLNAVWELCKYSIKATSFTGTYVDGDRERIPYEADALINQLSHYGVAREFSIARHTMEYLINRATWPTEWILQSVLMAWEDFMYTGNPDFLRHYYSDLKAKTLLALADEKGFISTTTGKVTPEVLQSIHFNGNLRDIVDWPHTGILGLGKSEGGETDGFIFKDVNTVVNAYHYRALVLMARIAATVGKPDDEKMFSSQAEKLKKSFNEGFLDRKRGIYVDGIGTDHASLHANMFPLAFGLVPEKNMAKVTAFIRSRGMACSVYGSQFLLDAIYDGNDAAYGLKLLASTAERSWYNMIRVGSTLSLEAWDNKYKPNQDWNHAWGAAPANLIPRKLMGIEPIGPGFSQIRVKPQPADLQSAGIVLPTIRGKIRVAFKNEPGRLFQLEVSIPANTTAEVYLPFWSANQKVTANGNPVIYAVEGDFAVIRNVGSGDMYFEVKSEK
jgi:alpha-L-rhamnosidase